MILDVGLPDASGFEIFKRLRATSDVPVVFLTMHTEPAYARRALEAGAAGYVLKHAAPQELLHERQRG